MKLSDNTKNSAQMLVMFLASINLLIYVWENDRKCKDGQNANGGIIEVCRINYILNWQILVHIEQYKPRVNALAFSTEDKVTFTSAVLSLGRKMPWPQITSG